MTVLDACDGVFDPDDRDQSVITGNHRTVRRQSADLSHKTGSIDERRGPARVGVRGDKNIPGAQVSFTKGMYDAGAALDGTRARSRAR